MPDIDGSARKTCSTPSPNCRRTRAAYLDRHCPGLDLRREVESLLPADGPPGTRVGTVIGQGTEQVTLGGVEPGQMFGPYRVASSATSAPLKSAVPAP